MPTSTVPPDAPPLLLLNPHPRRVGEIFAPADLAALVGLGDLVVHDEGPIDEAALAPLLPRLGLLLGQTAMGRDRLDRAPNLRGIINVETNFLPNIDYEACFARGIHVLAPSGAFAAAVAEMALGLALDLVRGISRADREFRAGREQWGLASNEGCFHLAGSDIGLIGYGDLGRALHRLLAPFGCRIAAYDPWLPDHFLRTHGLEPLPLDRLLGRSRVVFCLAAPSSENAHFIGRAEFEHMQPGSAFLLLSRAAVVDFPEMLRQAGSGRLRIATDVFPDEPVAAADPMRDNSGMLFSAHRAGAMTDALLEIGRQSLADAGLILRGLPPVMCRRAQRETVTRSRSRPIERT